MAKAPARAAALAAAVALALAAPRPAAPHRVKHLDVDVDTPVYRLAPDLPVHEGQQHYRLSWSGFPVARVRVEMRPDAGGVGVLILGATHPVIDWLWRYRFEGRGRVNTDPFAPAGFVVDECENREHQRTEIRFGEPGEPGRKQRVRGLRHARGRIKEYVFDSSNTFDIPATVYLALNLDYLPGARFAVDTFTGKSRYLVEIQVEKRDAVRLGDQRLDAWRLRLVTRELTDDDPEGRHRETHVWVTPERPRRLLRAVSRTFVGSILLELEPEGTRAESLSGARCA